MALSTHITTGRETDSAEAVVKKTGPASKALIIAVYVTVFWILIPGFLLLTGFRLDALWPVTFSNPEALLLTGIGLSTIGGVLVVAAMGQLWFQGKGLPISDLPPTEFVASGLYRVWRHPIYVGFSILFAGVGCLLESFWSVAFATPVLVLGWMAYVLFFEEGVLVERFGPSYERYRSRVGLLLPIPRRRLPYRLSERLPLSRFIDAMANHTVLLRIGPIIIVTYGLLLATGAMLMAVVTAVALIQHGISTYDAGRFVVYAALAVGPFGWVFWWMGNAKHLIKERFFGVGQIGFVSYGAVTALAAVCAYMAHQLNTSIFLLSDALMLGLFLAYAVGRLGCLTYGCCYGKETEGRLHVVYENPEAKMIRLGDHRHIRRHPVQLYAAAHGLVAFGLLWAVSTAAVPAGLITALGLMLAGAGRTFTESFRDRARPLFGRFTWGHVGSWVLCLGGWAMLWLISPQVEANAPMMFSFRVLADHASLWAFVGGVGLIILIVFGFHWRRIGVWFG